MGLGKELRQIFALRITCLDSVCNRSALPDQQLTQSMNSDLAAAQALGNHRSPQTTWTHYTSSGVKKRYLERIGEVILLRERWIGSKGIIDPRWSGGQRSSNSRFHLLHRFHSPRPNQKHGQACTAFGECPGCPSLPGESKIPFVWPNTRL